MFTGLFRVVGNDDQLATVLSHEIAHALAHHASERIARASDAPLLDWGAHTVDLCQWANNADDGRHGAGPNHRSQSTTSRGGVGSDGSQARRGLRGGR